METVVQSLCPARAPVVLGRWFVLHTKSRQEKALAADLAALGIDHYLPLVRIVRYYGRRKLRIEATLFPGYVFLHGEIESAYLADRTDRVAGIISVADQERLEADLANIRLALDRGGHLTPVRPLTEGMVAEVRAG